MSRRAVKRFEQALQSETPADPTSEEEDDAPINQPPPKSTQGLFALLADDDDDDDADDGADNDDSPDQAAAEEIETKPEPAPAPAPSSSKKRKKRKKPRKRRDAAELRENDPDWIALNEASNSARADSPSRGPGYIPDSYFADDDGADVRDEAKRILASLEETLVIADDSAAQQQQQQKKQQQRQRAVHQQPGAAALSALRVEPRNLNADNELKRLFGARVVDSERRTEEAASAGGRARRGHGGARARRNVQLVTPRDTWFDHAPGLIMEADPEASDCALEEGVKYFRYAHESSYARVQDEYRMLVNLHNPNLLNGLLSKHPYHVDSLLQVAEVYRQMGEVDTAGEYIERCLYILEGSWNVSFKPFDGSCRLSFDVLENRSLYIGLFRYSQMLTRRGLHRTALEISKLLLNLDPEQDPMGMLMLADSYALLSGEYEWVVEMHDKYKAIPLEYFPNFAASRALATESMRLKKGGTAKRKGKGGGSASGNHGRDEAGKADEMLTDAILTFPMIVKPLLSAIQDSSTVWAESRLYDEPWHSAECEDRGVLVRMARVYAERSKLLWNSPANKELLLRCARQAGALDDEAGLGVNPATGKPSAAFVRDPTQHARVARCRAARVAAARWLGHSGLYDKVQIADFADSTTNLPAEILAGDDAQRAVGAAPPREVSMAQGALEFLQSLLPWREAQDATQSRDGE